MGALALRIDKEKCPYKENLLVLDKDCQDCEIIVLPSLVKVTLEPAASEPDILLNSCCGLYLNDIIFPPVLLRRKYRWKDQRLLQSHPQTKICYNLVL